MIALKLGPAGAHPREPIADDDGGELRVALAADPTHGLVRIAFGTSIAWMALPAEEARALAQMLVEMADEVDRGKR